MSKTFNLDSTCRAELTASLNVYSWDYLWTELTRGLDGPPIDLHVIRHAQSASNAQHLITGGSDVGLSWRGYVQALALGIRIPRQCDAVWVSTLSRSYRTLEIAASVLPKPISKSPVCLDSRLNERALGELEGTPHRVIPQYASGDLNYAPQNGESYLDLARRVLSFLLDLRRHTKHEMSVLVATHVGPMRLLVGIIEQFEDPRSVLALRFSNAESHRCVLQALTWPAFIKREVVFEPRGTMEAANRATRDTQI